MEVEKKYFTFPVSLLDGFSKRSQPYTESIKDVTNDIMSYCGYIQALKESGTSTNEKLNKAGNYFGVTWGNQKEVFDCGKMIDRDNHFPCPMTSVSIEMIFDFHSKDKTEFEIVCFLAFVAIRSVLQVKPYVKLTNDFLIARMAGMSNAKELHLLPQSLKNYYNRYQLDKIKSELQNNWGLVLYARHTRGFYVSFGKTKLKDLVLIVEKKRKGYRDKLRKDEQQKAVKEAMNILFPEAT